MIKSNFDSKLSIVIKNRNFLFFIAVIQLIVIFFMLFIIISQTGKRERIVIVPTEINKSFWINDSTVSDRYLEQMASYFSQLVLNVTPRSVDKSNEIILSYTSPEGYGTLKADLLENARKIKEDGITTAFYPESFEIDPHQLTVIITGNLVRIISQEKLPTIRKQYEMVFEYKNAKLSVKTFKEITHA